MPLQALQCDRVAIRSNARAKSALEAWDVDLSLRRNSSGQWVEVKAHPLAKEVVA